jgi:hypothetical protein
MPPTIRSLDRSGVCSMITCKPSLTNAPEVRVNRHAAHQLTPPPSRKAFFSGQQAGVSHSRIWGLRKLLCCPGAFLDVLSLFCDPSQDDGVVYTDGQGTIGRTIQWFRIWGTGRERSCGHGGKHFCGHHCMRQMEDHTCVWCLIGGKPHVVLKIVLYLVLNMGT